MNKPATQKRGGQKVAGTFSNIKYLRENSHCFRELAPKELAERLREKIETTQGEGVEFDFDMFCILKAADLIEKGAA